LPVVWAVAKGSLLNKAILVPSALAISVLAPWLVTPLLMVGGSYLCFEGFEKLAHRFLHNPKEDEAHRAELLKALQDTNIDLVALERDRIKGAIRTDFILSAEIIAIALGTVAGSSLMTQFLVLAGVAAAMTVGVYGFVAAIVKLDDLGLWMSVRGGPIFRATGRLLVNAAPWLMKFLSVAGTAAMFFVGGGILVHGVPALHHGIEALVAPAGAAAGVLAALADALLGVVAGAVVLGLVTAAQRLRARFTSR
jgi:predicted DNA repair protein MutK